MLKKILQKHFKSSKGPGKQLDNKYSDITQEEWDIINEVSQFTMTSIERIKVLLDSVKYLRNNNINGDFVECGTWKGGSVMAMIKQLNKLSDLSPNIWVFDTFDGMPEPAAIDRDFKNTSADDMLKDSDKNTSNIWAFSSFQETKNNILSTGYPENKVSFVKGLVEETIPTSPIQKIALLRLDTDWYSSTKVELEYFFPKIVPGGILIIDDYGHWQGCKKAVDEYFEKIEHPVFINRIDYTGRMIVKNF